MDAPTLASGSRELEREVMADRFSVLGCSNLGFRVWRLGFGVWGLGFGVKHSTLALSPG